MTPTLCAIIASEGIPAFGRNETAAIIIMLAENPVFKSANKKSKQSLLFALRFSRSLSQIVAHEPNITTASQGPGISGVNKREADVTPLSRSLLAEAAVAHRSKYSGWGGEQTEGRRRKQSLWRQTTGPRVSPCIKSHALPHPRCCCHCCCCCYLLHRHHMKQPQVGGEPQRRSFSPLKCKAAEAAVEALLRRTSLFCCDNGMRAVNVRLCGRKDKKKKKTPYCGANNYQASSCCLLF